MPVTLQPEERDALWGQITANFTLFGDLDLAMHEGDEEACYKLGRKIADGLRLIIDGGLGWQQRTAAPTVLTLPDTELRGIMARMKEQAVTHYESRRPDAEESQAEMDEIATVRTAADSVFDQTRSG
jgi:hypothetical protein